MGIIQKIFRNLQVRFQKPTQAPLENLTSDAYAPAVIVPPEAEKKPQPRMLPLLLAILVILIIAVFYPLPKYLPKISQWVHVRTNSLKSVLTPKVPAQPIAVIAPVESKSPGPADSPKAMTAAPVSAALNIQGIMTNNGSSVVLINGKVYEAGDDVEGTKLVSVGENSVTVLRDGKTETFQLRR